MLLKTEEIYTREERELLSNCTLCPRECRADRFRGGDGYCGADAGMNIASVCIHRGEEPPVSGPDGICNIFFTGCNMRCIYCQNYDISRPAGKPIKDTGSLEVVLDKIERIISQGIRAVGFVSPSHVIPQVRSIIRGLKARGLNPVMVYNTNGYDKPEVIDSLDGMIDVWLPDYKYVTPGLALEYSDTADYPGIALKALGRMYYQTGSTLRLDENGVAEKGMLIRHLVLPGHAEESMKVLRSIAEELSPGVHLSLMSQYHPVPGVNDHFLLNRSVYREEYELVAEEMQRLGFRNGWVQDMDSNLNYRPDFRKENPFE
ncbi:MAG: radical SAM protein [Bacteroidales bacterium]|jgi:putative pyruvate formate lyase activating enzyme